MHRSISRRTLLRGTGVALTLPWLPSLERGAAAQAVDRKRFLPIYLPNGAAEVWRPTGAGQGNAWQLSSVLAPLAALKAKVTVLTGLENGTAFNSNGSSSVEPSHGRQPGAWLTCIDPAVVRSQRGMPEVNRPSVDQLVAKQPGVRAGTRLPSLQVGLSTWYSFCDGQPCSNSRTVSWSEAGSPMYKMVDPLEVFNKMVGAGLPVADETEARKRLALDKSVLDAVLESAAHTHARLGKEDRLKLDEFMTHVRSVEKQATTMSSGMGGLACQPIAKPTNGPILPNGARQNSATYNKGAHADLMNELIVMAFQCDITRVISYMLEDERSEFSYGHVPKRTFTATASSPGAGVCGEYHNNGQHGSQDEFATITWWNVGKVAALCAKLDAIKEGERSLLDNSVVFLGSCMHGSNHSCSDLPTALIGSGGGKLKTDQHIVFRNRWLRDVHYTIMKDVFGMSGPGVDDFGVARSGNPNASIRELVAS